MNHYNSLWKDLNVNSKTKARILKANQPGSPRTKKSRKNVHFDLNKPSNFNTYYPKLAKHNKTSKSIAKHIGECHDSKQHRGCIYNILDDEISTSSSKQSDINSLKQRLTESDTEKIDLQNQIARYQSRLRISQLEIEKSRDSAKQLKTLAGIIHDLQIQTKQHIEDKKVCDNVMVKYENELELTKLSEFLFFCVNIYL